MKAFRGGTLLFSINVSITTLALAASSTATWKQYPVLWVHRGVPELLRVHLAQSFVTLNLHTLLGCLLNFATCSSFSSSV